MIEPRTRGELSLTRFVALFMLAAMASGASAQDPSFRDASDATGTAFRHVDDGSGMGMGGGLAWFDLDADGDDDLFLTSSDGMHRLLRNDGAEFTDVTTGSGIDAPEIAGAIAMGVVAADVDGDGTTDLFVMNLGPDHLFLNRGDGTFREVASELGVAGDAWSASAAWADFDRDGDLDLYVGNYVERVNFPFHDCHRNALYLNPLDGLASAGGIPASAPHPGDASGLRFVEVAGALGVDDDGCALSVATLDYDDDGDADLMVGNDFGEFVRPNALFRNDTVPGGPLRFSDVSEATAFDDHPHYNMGIAGSDYDGDGDWDLYLTNVGDNFLLRNDDGVFVDVAPVAGAVEGRNPEGALLVSWGIAWVDLDNDGLEDLVVVNGDLSVSAGSRAPNHVWMNRGDGTLARVDPAASGMADPGPGRGLGVADANADGLVDLYVVNNGAVGLPEDRSGLFLNVPASDASGAGSWVQVRLHGRDRNTEGIGARLDAEVGGRVQRRQVLADPVYLSSHSRVVHFGLGEAASIERLVVRWPSGTRQELYGLADGVRFDVTEPAVVIDEVRRVTQGRSSRLEVVLRNVTDDTRRFRLRRANSASPTPGEIGTRGRSGHVAPGSTTTVHVAEPQGRPAGGRLVVVEADGAIDARRVPVRVPERSRRTR